MKRKVKKNKLKRGGPSSAGEPAWPSGKALRLVSRRTSVRSASALRFGSPFSSEVVVYGHLSRDFALTMNEALKWLTQLPTLMQSHSGGDSVASSCKI